nr:MAG TPA: hypothetical protein [Caudoviricetes sp.]
MSKRSLGSSPIRSLCIIPELLYSSIILEIACFVIAVVLFGVPAFRPPVFTLFAIIINAL